jgi:hypothetical protein
MFMSSDPTPTEPAPAESHADFYRGILHGMIAGGADFANMLHLQAKARFEAAPETAEITKPALAHDRLTRGVRRGILMAQHLDNPVQRRQSARRQIIRQVEDAIQRHAIGEEADALQAELCDRLDSPDVEEDIGDRPVADIIKDICRDLGLIVAEGAHPWKRRTPEDVAALNAQASQVCRGRPSSAGVKGRSPLPARAAEQSSEPSAATPPAAAATTSQWPGLPRQTDPPFARSRG